MPGFKQEGLPVPSLGYKTLIYNCNALWSLYATMATAAALHLSGIFRLTEIIDNYGPLMTVAMIWGFAVSFGMYFVAVATGTQMRMSGNFIYDVFMGASLNPRIGPIDLKMWAEVRIPWNITFFLAVSGACKQYETYGYVTPVCIHVISCHPCILMSNLIEYGFYVPCNMALCQRLVCHFCRAYIKLQLIYFLQRKGRRMHSTDLGYVPREVGIPRDLLELRGRAIRKQTTAPMLTSNQLTVRIQSYIYSVVYMSTHDPEKYRFSTPTYVALFTTLLVAYYM